MDDHWLIEEDSLWDVLCSQPGVGVHLLDSRGTITFANCQALQFLIGTTRGDAVGRSIEELAGPEYAAELKQVMGHVISKKRPSIFEHVRLGRLLHSFLWPVGRKRVLAVTRPGRDDLPEQADFPVVQSQYADWGPLDVLSPRELEVLALLGQGLPLKKIADQLGLSIKTVERHRTSIGRKLKVKSLAELSRLVHDAGLTLKRAESRRIDRRSVQG